MPNRYASVLVAAIPTLACPGSATDAEDVTLAPTSLTTPDTVPTTTDELAEPTTGDPDSTSTTGTTTSGTTTAPSTTSTGEPECGNGIIEVGEKCDDGAENQDHNACKENCQPNECGDEKILEGVEECDDGDKMNGDGYGHKCTSECTHGDAYCGDGKLQPEHETCDLGPDNGTDQHGVLCDNCQSLSRRGFVTSEAFHGDLGGLEGAHIKCQQAAEVAELPKPERFRAYLSTDASNANGEFADIISDSWPLVFVTGPIFVDNFATLLSDGPKPVGLSLTEYGKPLYSKYVATNTGPGGVRYSFVEHCQNWTSSSALYLGRVGLTAVSDDSPDLQKFVEQQWWTGFNSWKCDKKLFHLYCIEL